MMRSLLLAAGALAASAQQPEQAHLSLTGAANTLSLDFMHHDANVGCNATVGVQIGTTPDFKAASFVPAYACDDFTAEESAP
jgi:hypothetical protein